jgi:cellulose synthase operon protein YhjQ
MTENKAITDSFETPEDVATLYSWANLHGAKYRDFSASRAQTREKARQRVQDAIDAEQRRARDEIEAQEQAEMQLQAEAQHHAAEVQRHAAEVQMQAEMEARQRAEQEAAERAAAQYQQAAQQRAWTPQPPAPPLYQAAQSMPSYPPGPAPTPYQEPSPSYAAPAYPQAPPYHAPHVAPAPAYPQYGQQQPYAPAPPVLPVRDERIPANRGWAPPEPRENLARPAWLAADRNEIAAAPPQPSLHDTLQGSRDRITSRWFALKGLFAGAAPAQADPLPAPAASRAPVLAVFSLAGGVGKTSLVATLGRALSARGERVLLVDTAAYGLLPFFFGARDQRPGVLRTFTAPGNSGDAPVQLLTMDCENLGPETVPQEPLSQEIGRHGYSASRILIDLATASGAITRRVLRMSPTVLVPVIPDMSSVVSVGAIDTFFQRNNAGSGQTVMPFYVLNQFDPSLPLHLDVREVLREQLGDRLLSFSMRRAPAVSEALAEGMTVVDYAPNSTVAEDFATLAGWVKSLAAPASSGFRGVRWSER